TVYTIQNPALTRNICRHVFASDVAFNHADGKITQLSADSNNQASQNQLPYAEEWKRESKNPGQNHGNCERAKCAFPGFIGTDFAPQRMATEDFSESEGRDVAQRRRAYKVTDKAVSVARVGEKSEATGHPADVNVSDDRGRHTAHF